MVKKACVAFPIGCPRSMHDAALFVEYFKKNGWQITTDFREADTILLGTCAFTLDKENTSLRFLSIAYRKKKKHAQIIAFGCLPGINAQKVKEKFDIEMVTSSSHNKLDDIIKAEVKISKIESASNLSQYEKYICKSFNTFEQLLARNDKDLLKQRIKNYFFRLSNFNMISPLSSLKNIFNPEAISEEYNDAFTIKVAKGCLENCSYCAIKQSTGDLRSKTIDAIMKEFEVGLIYGYNKFALLGEDVGAYGQDLGTSIVELLKCLFSSKADFQLVISDFHPRWLIKYFSELYEIFSKNNNKLNLLGFPVQSGSDKILKLMKRDYTAEKIKKCLLLLKQKLPYLPIETHIMVGFPQETNDDFVASLNFIQEIEFDSVCVYKFSDRPNTLAAKIYPKVDGRTKEIRRIRMYIEAQKT